MSNVLIGPHGQTTRKRITVMNKFDRIDNAEEYDVKVAICSKPILEHDHYALECGSTG